MTVPAAGGRRLAVRVVLAHGFRPFFLLAGLHAALTILAWLGVTQGRLAAPAGWPPAALHGHEMIFGFATAALAGFLLTAVPNWTGTAPVAGRRLALLVLAWLAGRAGALAGAPALYAAFDLAFLPALAACVAPAILRASARRNGIVLAVLAAIWGANVAAHLAALGTGLVPAGRGGEAGLAFFVVLVALIGGRIVPAFTASGLRQAGRPVSIAAAPGLDRAALATTGAWALAVALGLPDAATGVAAGLAAAANGARFARWRTAATLGVPLVWVLHLGQAWLVLGLAAASAAAFGALPPATALHALGAGAVGTMILAVMSRATLGHTGRALAAGTATALSFALVALGALARVLATMLPDAAPALLPLAGLLWAGGYALFCLVYAPMLLGPRADGRPG